ncbi:hypothetical protein [Pseudomonas japonica]|uniref:hypothetical protein n=1 Tax=Pseudomonas japonica TaxID=256466 RepID=UPI003A86BFAC
MAGELRTSVVLDMVDRITAPLRRVTQAFSGMGSRMGFDRLSASSRRVEQSFKGIADSAKGLRDNLSRTFDRISSSLRRVTQTMAGMARRVGFDRLIASGKRVGDSFKGISESAKGLRDNLLWIGGTAAASTWGVEHMVSSVADLGNEVRTSAERLGVGTRWLQEWIYAGKQYGIENDALVDGFKELGLRADEFVKTGQGGAAESFQRLGITVKDLRKTAGETDKILDLVRSRMGKIENDAARQRIFDELFGGTGGEQMLVMLTDARDKVDELRKTANETGAVFSDEEIEQARIYSKQMSDLRSSLFSIQRTVVGMLLPAINDWMSGLKGLSKANREAISQEIITRLKELWSGLQTVWRWTSMAADMVNGFGNLIGILAGLMAGKLLFSVAASAMEMANFGKEVVKAALRLSGRFIMAIFQSIGALGGLAARAIPLAIAGIRALSLAMLTTPIGLITTGITALAGAVYLIYRNWDSISDWFSDLWGNVKNFFEQGIGEIVTGLLAFSPAGLLLKAIDAVFEIFGSRPLSEIGANWISGLWDGVRGKFDQLSAWLKESIGGLTDWLPDWMTGGEGIAHISAPIASAPPAVSLGARAMTTDTPSPLAVKGQKADVGGELRIKIDSEGRVRVASAKSNGGMGYSVETGQLGMVP